MYEQVDDLSAVLCILSRDPYRVIVRAHSTNAVPTRTSDPPEGSPQKARDPRINAPTRAVMPWDLNDMHCLLELPAHGRRGVKDPSMTYHTNPDRWRQCDNDWFLKTVGMGQEFVTQANPAILNWAANLF